MASTYLWFEALGNSRKWALGLAYEGLFYNTKTLGFYYAGHRELTVLNWESNMSKTLF